MRRFSVPLAVTMMLPLQTALSQQQQGEKTPQVSARR